MLSATPLLPLLAVGGLTMSSAFGLFSLLPLGSDDVHLAVLTVIGAGALPAVLSSGWFLIKATQKGCLYPQGYIAQCVSSIARRQVMVGCAMLTLASIITALGFETQGRCLNGVTVMEPADIDLLSREAKSGGEATRLPANLNIVKFISVKDTEYRKLKGTYQPLARLRDFGILRLTVGFPRCRTVRRIDRLEQAYVHDIHRASGWQRGGRSRGIDVRESAPANHG